jgi:hypothetical protein
VPPTTIGNSFTFQKVKKLHFESLCAMDDDFAFQFDPMSPAFDFSLDPNLQDIECSLSAPRSLSAAGKRARKSDSQNKKTKQIVEARLSQFDPSTSRAKKMLWELYGPAHNHDLLSLAKLCAHYLDVYLDREAQRLKPVLLKWFDENIEQIEPFLREHLVITCEDGVIGPPELVQQLFTISEQTGTAETS